jgi:hypothetical protein
MSVLSAIKTYMTANATEAGLASGAPLWTDYLGPNPPEYSINPLPGARVIEWYLDNGSKREFPFAFNAMFSTADEAERIENSGFFEALADWFETQTEADDLPTFSGSPTKTALAIEALGWAFLYEEGQSNTGVYQIQCRLVYEQLP